jgi:hypothetical protein
VGDRAGALTAVQKWPRLSPGPNGCPTISGWGPGAGGLFEGSSSDHSMFRNVFGWCPTFSRAKVIHRWSTVGQIMLGGGRSMCYSLAHSTPRAELLGGGGATSVNQGGTVRGRGNTRRFPLRSASLLPAQRDAAVLNCLQIVAKIGRAKRIGRSGTRPCTSTWAGHDLGLAVCLHQRWPTSPSMPTAVALARQNGPRSL